MKKILVSAIFLLVSLCSSLNAMDYTAADPVLLETVQIVAEMCYRKKVDLDNSKVFDCTSECASRRIFSYLNHEAGNIFAYEEWKLVYPEGIETLVETWQDELVRQEIKKINENLKLLEFIKRLQPKSKALLLNQINEYSSSFRKILANGFYSLTSCSLVVGSIYLIFKFENQKIKGLLAASCFFSSLGAWHFAQKSKKAISSYSWWKSCTNFQQAMRLCKGS